MVILEFMLTRKNSVAELYNSPSNTWSVVDNEVIRPSNRKIWSTIHMEGCQVFNTNHRPNNFNIKSTD